MIFGTQIGQEQFICQDYRQSPYGSQRVRLGEQIPGGRAAGMSPGDFDPAQLAIGTRVEMEHTRDIWLAREIAMDHLAEDPAYYQKLSSIHLDGAQLGGFREDFVGTVGIVMGKAKAAKFLDDFEALVEQKAAIGAQKKVKPMIIGAMAVGGLGLLLGGVALVVAMRR
jgi:hypothetical protein